MIHQIVYRLSLIIVMTSQLIFVSPVSARWGTVEDAPIVVEVFNHYTTVDADGKSDTILEKRIKILNDRGREASIERIQYNPSTENVEIIEAKTIYDGHEYPVHKDKIERKALASSGQAFDHLMQIMIAYPQGLLGAELYIKYKIHTFKQPLPKYYAHQFSFSTLYWKHINISIKSELPFHYRLNDPTGCFDMKTTKTDHLQELTLFLKKPLVESLESEPAMNTINEVNRSWLSISTLNNYEDFSKSVALPYEQTISETFPQLQYSIMREAADIKNEVDQINKVTTRLAESIQYLGDWGSIDGKYYPRPLLDVMKTGYGDCKDFSASTAAILKDLGYKVQVALVIRQMGYQQPQKLLPSFDQFNHAIVKVTSKSGKVYWIDPTNPTSMADGLFPDIADRRVLVLDSKNPTYETIPPVNYDHSRTTSVKTLTIDKNDLLQVHGKVSISGENANPFISQALISSLKTIEEFIFKNLCNDADPQEKTFAIKGIGERIVQDLSLDYSYQEDINTLVHTNLGMGISLGIDWVNLFHDISEKQAGDSFLGIPETRMRQIVIKNVQAENVNAYDFHLITPWVELKRECKNVQNDVVIDFTYKLLKSFITSEDVKTLDFKKLKQTLKNCQNRSLVFRLGESKKEVTD